GPGEIEGDLGVVGLAPGRLGGLDRRHLGLRRRTSRKRRIGRFGLGPGRAVVLIHRRAARFGFWLRLWRRPGAFRFGRRRELLAVLVARRPFEAAHPVEGLPQIGEAQAYGVAD